MVFYCELLRRIALSIDIWLNEKETPDYRGDNFNRGTHMQRGLLLLEINMTKIYLCVKAIRGAIL
jgi:hypothetical protein